jgi:manganese efflux pump family protein
MEFITILLIAIGLSIDSFAVSVSSGLNIRKFKIRKVLRISLSLALFQAIMPVLGWLVGSGIEKAIKDYDHWVAFILLTSLSIKMFYEGFKKQDEKKYFNPVKWSNLISMSVATSIDALVIGLSFGLLHSTIVYPVIIIGITTFIISFSGVYIGISFRKRYEISRIEILGGLILLAIGIKILWEHLLV